MKIFRSALLTAAVLLPGVASADFVSFAAGGGIWKETPSGTFRKTTDPVSVDVTNDLFWGEENQSYLFARLEHPVPLLPNIRLMKTNVEHDGSGTLTRSITIDGTTYTASTDITGNVSFDQTDITLYWELLDNVVSLDLGLNAKLLKVDYKVVGGSTTTSGSESATVPMVYAMIGASPMPDLLLSAEMAYVSYDGSSLSDITVKLSYTTGYLLGFEAGYRTQNYTLDDVSNITADLTFKGPFAGLYVKF